MASISGILEELKAGKDHTSKLSIGEKLVWVKKNVGDKRSKMLMYSFICTSHQKILCT